MNQWVVGAFDTATSYLTLTRYLKGAGGERGFTAASWPPFPEAGKMPFQARHKGVWDCMGDQTQPPHFTGGKLRSKLETLNQSFQNQSDNRNVRPGRDHKDLLAKETRLVKVMGVEEREGLGFLTHILASTPSLVPSPGSQAPHSGQSRSGPACTH